LALGHQVDPTNLHRLPAARRLDAMTWLRRDGAPGFAKRLGELLSTPKTRLSARNFRRANRTVKVTTLRCDVADPRAVNALTQVDWIFLAADTNTARHVTNAVIQQYLVPGIQVGVSVPVGDDGQVGEVHVAIRPLLPGAACQWCQDLIDSSELALEAQPHYVLQQARYVRDLPAPAVMTLNTIAAGEAANYFMFSSVALHTDHADLDARTHFPRTRERDRQTAVADHTVDGAHPPPAPPSRWATHAPYCPVLAESENRPRRRKAGSNSASVDRWHWTSHRSRPVPRLTLWSLSASI